MAIFLHLRYRAYKFWSLWILEWVEVAPRSSKASSVTSHFIATEEQFQQRLFIAFFQYNQGKKKKKDLSYVFKNRSCILLSPEKLNSFYVFWVAAVFNSWRHFRTEQIELNAEKKTHIQKLLHFFILTIFEKYKWQTLLCAQYLDTWSVLMLLILFRGIGYGRR